jgi:Fe-S cluster biogenesis protein NfuA
MFIQTETTPNPDTIKFIPGKEVSPAQNYEFRAGNDTSASPLADALLALQDIEGVFLGADFISVSKSSKTEWVLLKPRIMASIMDFYSSGAPVIANAANVSNNNAPKIDENLSDEDKQIVSTIIELLDERIRPAVAQDGGDIIFHQYKEGIVYLEMHGACAGCPSSTITLKAGIENMLKHYIPEIVEVRPV